MGPILLILLILILAFSGNVGAAVILCVLGLVLVVLAGVGR